MTRWISFTHAGAPGFGVLTDDRIECHTGNLFENPSATGQSIPLADVQVGLPCRPGKFIGLWNNYHAQAAKQGLAIPSEPLYFLKASSSFAVHGQSIQCPAHYDGRVVYEGELGVVIGKRCKNADIAQAQAAIFGYTCVNDVTALDVLTRDASFAQWTRAKSFDGFGPFGPVIATGFDPSTLVVRTLLNGRERQNYPCSDMIFPPAEIVQALSREMTLEPGDVIACGTSLGVLPMKSGAVVEVSIEGIGMLRNTFHAANPGEN